MKFLTALSLLLFFSLIVLPIHAQHLSADTTMAKQHYEMAIEYFNHENYDSAIVCFEKASLLYLQHQQWKKYLNSETLHAECLQNLWQPDLALQILKPAIKLTLQQIIDNDTIVANAYHVMGIQYYYLSKYDSTLLCWKKALEIKKAIFGKNHISVANTCNNIGSAYANIDKFDLALEYCFKALHIEQEVLGRNSIAVADSYDNIGIIYSYKCEYDLALEYHFRALAIYNSLYNEQSTELAICYSNIGNVYAYKGDYDLALENYFKSLQLKKDLYGEEHASVAHTYYNLGLNYFRKDEFDLSLEYLFEALLIGKRVLSADHTFVADIYNVIGNVYTRKHEHNLALKYYFDANKVYKEMLGENHSNVAMVYDNIGVVYDGINEYDLSLDYYFKSLQMKKNVLGEKHIDLALTYNNIGKAYASQREYDKALEYFNKSLTIRSNLLGEKHADIAMDYFNIGNVYCYKSEYEHALQNYQKGLAAGLRNFTDTANIFTVPLITDYLNWNVLLEILQAKAEIFTDISKNLDGCVKPKRLQVALRHYQACDTLIGKARKEIRSRSDKIALGEKAYSVYEGAIKVCLSLSESLEADSVSYFNELAFGFSEKSKASVLRESLAAANARKFAGIPDALLDMEHDLSINITSYKQILAEDHDSLTHVNFQDKLFSANRSYDSLIAVFENSFPKYFDLKYKQEPLKLADIRKQLNQNTAIISYFTGDSSLTIFTLTAKDLEFSKAPIENSFDTLISDFCYYGLAYRGNPYRFASTYKQLAYDLYQKLIPGNLDKTIQNLIIIPDAALGSLPFEALLTAEPENLEWKDLPYLIKKYNISYAYSANLFFRNHMPGPANDEITPSKDLLALAPVFDDANIAGTTIETQTMLDEIYAFVPDSISTRGRLINGDYIRELPGTETEVMTVFDTFEKKNLSATLKIRSEASEEFVKSGELKNYRYLHFATHGFVNVQNPELSGLFLAQDTLSTEDCILYTGEMYNLDLNADLVVLSACETGLGKAIKGEGIIGLGRALIYAGTQNIVVSLWEVPDLSTSALMTGFYNKMLDDKRQNNISTYMRQAKLNMIDEGTYAHPYYWSPFILIGK